MFVPHKPQPPSRQASELGGRIANLVQEYLMIEPEVSGRDVMQAFDVARSLLPPSIGGLARRQRLLIAMSIAMLVLGVLVALYLGSLG